MALFQKSILNSVKHDESLIALRWAAFQNYIAKVDAIRDFKEEIYQDGFFKDIFESCLGYTLNTTNPHGYTLEREKKNETDGKKADGVIVINGEIIGVVELKDQKTKNLDAVETQAFNYHASHSRSQYIIISNFDELRFYIDKKTVYEKFNLFTLTYAEFKTLHLLLSFESIKEGIPLTLKEKSATFEATISKQLYKDFSAFRTHLFDNIVKNNYSPLIPANSPVIPAKAGIQLDSLHGNDKDLDKQTLLRLTQKLCDRIIFILFAEDRGLLHPNTIKEIRTRHAQDVFGHPIYAYYKIYFNAINTGHEKLGIPKYNGGLFAPDALLDSLIIEDAYLDMEAQKLSDYDFESDISVNILGHIFEQSLTDLEEMEKTFTQPSRHPELDSGSTKKELDSRLRGNDKSVSKRKKDGIFYTPEYITRYIVENTLGKLCADKRDELAIGNETLVPHNLKKLTKEEIKAKENLLAYREWLTHLKILDPACGSGAFLNQALEFLIREHTLIRDLLLPFQDLMIGYEIEKSILEHNLYGVDINEDAVEIAKLSLWLRTAQKGRTLTDLSDKIKCGNSLIDDKSIAENAFMWEEEFKEVFEHGGFDVVIGNPPYLGGRDWKNKNTEKYFIENYKVAEYQFDMYILFYELAINMAKINGLISLITPNTWLNNQKNTKLREFILSNTLIKNIIDYTQLKVFEDATVLTIIATLQKNNEIFEDTLIFKPNNEFLILSNTISQKSWLDNDYFVINIDTSNDDNEMLKKIEKSSQPLEKIAQIKFGVKLYETGKGNPKQLAHFAQDKIYESNYQIDETYKKYITGKDIERYFVNWENTWVKYGNNLAAPRDKNLFINNRIVVRRIVGERLISTRIKEDLITSQLLQIVKLDDENLTDTITAILNSKLMIFYFRKKYNRQEKTFPEIRIYELASLPIPLNIIQNKAIDEKVNKIIDFISKLNITKQNFYNEFGLEKLSNKLQKFEELGLDEFVKEYTKAKKIKFADKLEERNFKKDWSALFENDKKEVLEIQNKINQTDKEIDSMVYELYGLSDEEIGIVDYASK